LIAICVVPITLFAASRATNCWGSYSGFVIPRGLAAMTPLSVQE